MLRVLLLLFEEKILMNLIESVKNLSVFERCLWGCSVLTIIGSCVFSKGDYGPAVAASLVGVTALIFIAKGDAIGQLLTVIFSILYSLVSLKFRYFGEIFTYLGMTAPIAVVSMISWLKNPYKAREVKVNDLKKSSWVMLFLAAAVVTFLFYFILKACGTTNLFVSTISIATSFAASGLMFFRSPYYALAYAANDIVLIILWVMAAVNNIEYLSMVICFVIFFINDLYGFWNWRLIKIRQSADKSDISIK